MTGGSVAYWLVVVVFVAFGFLALMSIGAPFLLLGVTLAALWPFRDRREVFWPWLSGVVTFIAVYVLVAPLGCTIEETARSPFDGTTTSGSVTVCRSIVGIEYRGTGDYNPPLWPAAGAALGLAVIDAGAVWLALRRTP